MTDPKVPDGRDKTYPTCGGKKRQSEGVCTRPAGWGTDHPGVGRCKLHGGSTQSHRQHSQGQMATRALQRLGVPLDGAEPADQLLQMVREAAGNVACLRDLVGGLVDPERLEEIRAELDDDPTVRPLYVRMFHQSNVPTGEAKPHVLVAMYDAERDRLVRYSKAAIECGLATRQVEMAEMQAAMVARVIMAVLDDPGLALSREARELGRQVAGRHMRVLAGASTMIEP